MVLPIGILYLEIDWPPTPIPLVTQQEITVFHQGIRGRGQLSKYITNKTLPIDELDGSSRKQEQPRFPRSAKTH